MNTLLLHYEVSAGIPFRVEYKTYAVFLCISVYHVHSNKK